MKQKKKEKQNVLFASAGEKTLRNKLPKIIKDNIIYQPQMRFKPRTDLERVFDALTGNYFMSNEKEILNRQLKHLDLFDYKKPSDIYKSLLKEEKKEEEKAGKLYNENSRKSSGNASECCENDREKRSGVQNGGDIGRIGLSEAPFDIQEALAKRRSGDNVLHHRLRKYERYLFEQRHRGSL